MLDAGIDGLEEPAADRGPHGTAHKGKFESGCDHGQTHELAAHGDQGLGFAGLLDGLLKPLLIILDVFELDAILGLDVVADLFLLALVKKISSRLRALIGRWWRH